MNFLHNYIIKKKKVKNASIRITGEKEIIVTVPLKFSDKDITSLINKKQSWINKTFNRINSATEKISLKTNQIILFGKPYKYKYNAALKNKVAVNFDEETIDSDFNLNNKKIQNEWYKIMANDYLTRRTSTLSKKHNLAFNKVTIRGQKTRWGSCSSAKNLSLNWKLMKAPHYVIDYIIMHELAHTKHLNHSKSYWKFVENICPAYLNAEDWLKKNCI